MKIHIVALLFALSPAAAAADAIDCGKARMVVDRLICDSPALRDDDRRIARAYRRLLAAMDPASADALRRDQRGFIGARDGVMAPRIGRMSLRGGAEQLTGRLKQRSEMLDAVVARPAPGLFGTWRNHQGTVRLQPDGRDGIALDGYAVDQRDGRWTCDVAGRGTVRADDSATIAIPAGTAAGWSIVATRRGATLDLVERPARTPPYCGQGGAMAGRYFRIADED